MVRRRQDNPRNEGINPQQTVRTCLWVCLSAHFAGYHHLSKIDGLFRGAAPGLSSGRALTIDRLVQTPFLLYLRLPLYCFVVDFVVE